MNAMFRTSVFCVLLIGCMDAVGAEQKPSKARIEYDNWIKYFNWDSYKKDEPLPKLRVIAIEGDEPPVDVGLSREVRYGCGIAADWGVYNFYSDAGGTKGGGGTKIPAVDRKASKNCC